MSSRDLRDTHELLVQVCSADACRQGRINCPTPMACRLPEFSPQPGANLAIAAALVAACVVVALILAGVMP
jgi:hypothetical protein